MLKVSITEPADFLQKLLKNIFADKVMFKDDDYDLRIVVSDSPADLTDPKTIYLSATATYGDPDTAGKIFYLPNYSDIKANLEENNYYIKEFIYYIRTKFFKEYTVAFAEISITSACNLSCEHCSIAKLKSGPALPVAVYKNFLDEFKKQGGLEVTFTGGEPSLEFDLLCELAHYCKSLGLYNGIVSNGIPLTSEKLALLKANGMNHILVTLYGKNHDKFTRSVGSFERSLQTARAAQKMGFNTLISTVATHETLNDGSFDFLLDIVKREGVRLFVNKITPVGRYAANMKNRLTVEDLRKLKNYLQMECVKKSEKYFYGYAWGCHQAHKRIYISSSGDICPCPFVHISFGNILTDTLETVKNKIQNSGFLGEIKGSMCLASQSDEFIKNFLEPIEAGNPTYYQQHPWFIRKGQ